MRNTAIISASMLHNTKRCDDIARHSTMKRALTVTLLICTDTHISDKTKERTSIVIAVQCSQSYCTHMLEETVVVRTRAFLALVVEREVLQASQEKEVAGVLQAFPEREVAGVLQAFPEREVAGVLLVLQVGEVEGELLVLQVGEAVRVLQVLQVGEVHLILQDQKVELHTRLVQEQGG